MENLVLWQPVVRGELFIKQFLQLRTAASMMSEHPETVQQLRERLAKEQSVEVAGYEIAQDLVAAIDSVNLGALTPPPGAAVHWIELVIDESQALGAAARQTIERWKQAGTPVSTHCVVGDPFWNGKEIHLVPAVIEETTRIFAPMAQHGA